MGFLYIHESGHTGWPVRSPVPVSPARNNITKSHLALPVDARKVFITLDKIKVL
jgi:hypothetical protein